MGERAVSELSAAEVQRLVDELRVRRAELETQNAALVRALFEKDALARELQHRLKNQLQVVMSLTNLEAEGLPEAVRPRLFALRDRIAAMALLYERLQASPSGPVLDFAEYARRLTGYLLGAHGEAAKRLRLSLAVPPTDLPLAVAVPCGLILHELFGNALQHAFPAGRSGELAVGLDGDATSGFCLWVRDSGVGLPPGLDLHSPQSLGLRLVQTLARQLHGTVAASAPPGAELRVRFVAKPAASRS